jgi:hypothetical protein
VVVVVAAPARAAPAAAAAPAVTAAPDPAVPTVAAAPAIASPEGVAAPIPARPVPGVVVPAETPATPKIRVCRNDRRGCYDRRRRGIGVWVGVLRLRRPCCELAEHDQKARNCEHGFPTSRHDLLAPLVLIEPERVDTSRDESLRAHDANVFRWPCVEVA